MGHAVEVRTPVCPRKRTGLHISSLLLWVVVAAVISALATLGQVSDWERQHHDEFDFWSSPRVEVVLWSGIGVASFLIVLATRLIQWLRPTKAHTRDTSSDDRRLKRVLACVVVPLALGLAWQEARWLRGRFAFEVEGIVDGWWLVHKQWTYLRLYPPCGAMILLGLLLGLSVRPAPVRRQCRDSMRWGIFRIGLAAIVGMGLMVSVITPITYLVVVAIDCVSHAQPGWTEMGSMNNTVGDRLGLLACPAGIGLLASLSALGWQRAAWLGCVESAHRVLLNVMRAVLILTCVVLGLWCACVGFPTIHPQFAEGVAMNLNAFTIGLPLLALFGLIAGATARGMTPSDAQVVNSRRTVLPWRRRLARLAVGLLSLTVIWVEYRLAAALWPWLVAGWPELEAWFPLVIIGLRVQQSEFQKLIRYLGLNWDTVTSLAFTGVYLCLIVGAFIWAGTKLLYWNDEISREKTPLEWVLRDGAAARRWLCETMLTVLLLVCAIPSLVVLGFVLFHAMTFSYAA